MRSRVTRTPSGRAARSEGPAWARGQGGACSPNASTPQRSRRKPGPSRQASAEAAGPGSLQH